MALAQEKTYSISDIYALPEGQRAELIDGQLYNMAPPGTAHQKISWKLHQTIANYISSQNGNCDIYAAPFAVFLNADDKNYVDPDLSVICDRSKINDRGCLGAPDWIIEIVSPGNKPMDYFTKLFKYRNANVREYWIVDPAPQQIMVYRFEKETMEQYSFGEDIPVGIYEDFSVKIQ